MAKARTSTSTSTSTSTGGAVKEIAKRPGKTAHPATQVKNPDGKGFKLLDSLPTDYDFEKNSSLKSKQFATKAAFLDYQSALMSHKAAQFKAKADTERAMPADKETKKAAARLQRMAASMAELQKTLGGKGVDVAAIVAAAQAKANAAGATPTA
jgi:hypothetical protein